MWFFLLFFACTTEPPVEVIDADRDGFAAPEDCDDQAPSIYPGAEELCDRLDNDCDGLIDAADNATGTQVLYADLDGDGYGGTYSIVSCSIPDGFVKLTGDCMDHNPLAYPGAEEPCTAQIDLNCDGEISFIDGDGDGFAACVDCDDATSSVFPGATEVCNGRDDNCDSVIDEGLTKVWYEDIDGDSYGDDNSEVLACSAPLGYTWRGQDCAPADPAIHPSAVEICDHIDNDCDGAVNNAPLAVFFVDSDGDGYGAEGSETELCGAYFLGYSSVDGDCDDSSPTTFIGSPFEQCDDGVDSDCDGADGLLCASLDGDNDGWSIDVDCDDTNNLIGPATPWYEDLDGDGAGGELFELACDAPEDHVAQGGDCDDADDGVHPGAPELCDGVDSDCDGLINEDDPDSPLQPFYLDADHDGFGAELFSVMACEAPLDYVSVALDCDDLDDTIFYGAPELCDEVDHDCDTLILESDPDSPLQTFFLDEDGDGYGTEESTMACAAPVGYSPLPDDCNDSAPLIHPDVFDFADGVDSDCDGQLDEDEGTQTVSHAANIQPIWDVQCTGCHTGGGNSGGLNLDNAITLVNAPSSDIATMALFTPGDLNNSYIWLKLNNLHLQAGGAGNQMPPGGLLDEGTRSTIETWIVQGCPL